MGDLTPSARITFLGHSTVLLELAGLRIITDPVLFDRLWFLRRVPEPLDPPAIRPVDVALISHLHLDHFDRRSLAELGSDVRLIVPRGAGGLLSRLGFGRVDELGREEAVTLGALSIRAVQAAHGGFHPPFGPRAEAIGFLIDAAGTRIYFAGDTGLFPGMADLAGGLDVALVPVWGWGPYLGPGHLDPHRAATAVRLLRPRHAIPIHWGTFWAAGLGRVRRHRLVEPPREFAELVAQMSPATTVTVLLPGEAFDLDL